MPPKISADPPLEAKTVVTTYLCNVDLMSLPSARYCIVDRDRLAALVAERDVAQDAFASRLSGWFPRLFSEIRIATLRD